MTWKTNADNSPGGNVFRQDDKKRPSGGSGPPGGDKKDTNRGKKPSFKEPDGDDDGPDDDDPDDEDWGDYLDECWEEGEEEDPYTGSENCTEPAARMDNRASSETCFWEESR